MADTLSWISHVEFLVELFQVGHTKHNENINTWWTELSREFRDWAKDKSKVAAKLRTERTKWNKWCMAEGYEEGDFDRLTEGT